MLDHDGNNRDFGAACWSCQARGIYPPRLPVRVIYDPAEVDITLWCATCWARTKLGGLRPLSSWGVAAYTPEELAKLLNHGDIGRDPGE